MEEEGRGGQREEHGEDKDLVEVLVHVHVEVKVEDGPEAVEEEEGRGGEIAEGSGAAAAGAGVCGGGQQGFDRGGHCECVSREVEVEAQVSAAIQQYIDISDQTQRISTSLCSKCQD